MILDRVAAAYDDRSRLIVYKRGSG